MLIVLKKVKLFFALFFSFVTLNQCKLMNDNPIYNNAPEEFFYGTELQIAKAIRHNKPEDIERLYKENPGVNLNVVGRGGMTLLFWACAHRFPRTVEKLLQLGADPNQIVNDGKTQSHLVAMTASGVVDETFELLLKYGGNPDGEDEGTPAVFKTVYARRFDRMKFLLNKGANINAIDKQTGSSLVHFCSVLNQFEMVAYLIEAGADFNIKDPVGGSVALQVQKRKGMLDEKTEPWRAKVEQMLIERGVVFPVPRPWEQPKD